MKENKKIKIIKSCIVNLAEVKAGKVIELPRQDAKYLIANNLAVETTKTAKEIKK